MNIFRIKDQRVTVFYAHKYNAVPSDKSILLVNVDIPVTSEWIHNSRVHIEIFHFFVEIETKIFVQSDQMFNYRETELSCIPLVWNVSSSHIYNIVSTQKYYHKNKTLINYKLHNTMQPKRITKCYLLFVHNV